ncbi:MAG: hypothetical protein IJV68_03060 [Clostridia bacterium]|nr:hypothetical protein [Clostridia bacterium]
MKKRVLILFLYICSFVCSVAPIVVYFAINSGKYIKSYEDTFKLCFGGLICLVLLALKVIGKLKLPSSTVTFGIVFLLAYLLKSITDDLLVFSFLALIGDIADKVFFMIPISKMKKNIENEKLSTLTADKVSEAMERYFRGGV